MKNPINDLKKYREFLETIPLAKYREELRDVKWAEQDLPREMFPLASIFKYYWDERKFLSSFDKYFIRLKNGFVVFKEDYIRPIIENIDDIEKIKKVVKEILLELSGES